MNSAANFTHIRTHARGTRTHQRAHARMHTRTYTCIQSGHLTSHGLYYTVTHSSGHHDNAHRQYIPGTLSRFHALFFDIQEKVVQSFTFPPASARARCSASGQSVGLGLNSSIEAGVCQTKLRENPHHRQVHIHSRGALFDPS